MAKTVVVDTSVAIKWLSRDCEDYIEQADKLLNDALDGKVTLLTPILSKFEVGNVLLFGKKLTIEQASEVLDLYYSLPITFIDESTELSKMTFKYAADLDITYYAAAFVSLCKQYDAVLVTDNIKHQGKATNIKVIPIKDY